jgi:hypothetical protein
MDKCYGESQEIFDKIIFTNIQQKIEFEPSIIFFLINLGKELDILGKLNNCLPSANKID